GTADLVRVGLLGHVVREMRHAAGMKRRRPAGKAGYREVEAAPKEMDGTRLSDEAGAEELEDAIGADEREPETMGRVPVIGGVYPVFREADRVDDFVGRLVDRDCNSQLVQKIDHFAIEFGDGLRP